MNWRPGIGRSAIGRSAIGRAVLTALAFLAGGVGAFADVSDYIGRPVGSVRLLTEGRDTIDPLLVQVVETVVGQPLQMAQVRETIAHLFSLGRFEDVRVDATIESGRVTLRYDLVPIHPVTNIRFTGSLHTPGVDEGQLKRAVVDRYGASPPLGRLADMTRIIGDALREAGYLHASIVPHAEVEHSPEHATLVFTLEPGPRTTIGNVDIVGRPTVSQAEFLSRLNLTTSAPYQREALNARIEKYVAERRKHGYYESQVLPNVLLVDEDRIANVTVTVVPGPLVRVRFTGDPLPSDKREDLVPVEREGSVDEDLLEDSSNRIEEGLRAQGFRDATAAHSRAEANGELVITFDVKAGQQYRVASFKIAGNNAVPLSDLEPMLRLRDGQPFSESRLDADVSAVQDLYRRRGFASARARSAVEVVTATPAPAQIPVAVSIAIVEGVRTVVDGVTFTGNTAIDEPVLKGALALQPGAPFVPSQLAADRDRLQVRYQNLGYERATVDVAPQFAQNQTHVSIQFTIREGPQIFVDHILIVGNVRTSSEIIDRELQVKSGEPFSVAAVADSQRRLTQLGLFHRVQISELPHGEENTRDLLVTIEEAPPTTIGYGGGFEVGRVTVPNSTTGNADEVYEIAPRATFEIGRRNLFGKNRSLNLFASISLHPRSSEIFSGQDLAPSDNAYGLTEYRVVGTYREPRLFNTSLDALVNVTIEQQIRSSFDYRRASASAQITKRLSHALSATGSYQLQRTELLGVNVAETDPIIDRLFSQEPLRLSSFSASVVDDRRNDPINPTEGIYLSASGQIAAVAIGSQVGFVKSYFTAQGFHLLPKTNGIVLAASARLGLAEEFVFVDPIPEPERFFAGGDTTVRGFALDALGVRSKPPDLIHDTINVDGFPIGGDGLVILNAELRVPVQGGLGVVGFVDSGNVFARASFIDLAELRTAVGGGIRYKSPVGPIRIDVGFKIHPQQQFGESLTAWYVSFGQAF